LSCLVLSCLVFSCVLSCLVLSYLVLCLVLSCVLSCLVLSCVLSCLVLYCVVSCLVCLKYDCKKFALLIYFFFQEKMMPTSPHPLSDVAHKLLNKKAGGSGPALNGPDVSTQRQRSSLQIDENPIPSVPSRRRSVSSEHPEVLKHGTLAKNAPSSMVVDGSRLSFRAPIDSMPALADELVQKGWVQKIDTKSGKPYFFHRKSGDVQFDYPLPSRESYLDSMSSSSSTRDSSSTSFQGMRESYLDSTTSSSAIRRQSFSSLPSDSSHDHDERAWPHWGRVGNTEDSHRSDREDIEHISPLSSMSSGTASLDLLSSVPGLDPYSPKEDRPSSIPPMLPPRDVSLSKSTPPSPFDSDSSRLPPRQTPSHRQKRPTSLPLK
jgi:hypothetical protein